MIISDLNHLEVFSETSTITGGGKLLDIEVDIEHDQNHKLDIKGSNVNVINQVATATAVSVGFNRKAVAKAEVGNKIN